MTFPKSKTMIEIEVDCDCSRYDVASGKVVTDESCRCEDCIDALLEDYYSSH
jgi:hypothetical protein